MKNYMQYDVQKTGKMIQLIWKVIVILLFKQDSWSVNYYCTSHIVKTIVQMFFVNKI